MSYKNLKITIYHCEYYGVLNQRVQEKRGLVDKFCNLHLPLAVELNYKLQINSVIMKQSPVLSITLSKMYQRGSNGVVWNL